MTLDAIVAVLSFGLVQSIGFSIILPTFNEEENIDFVQKKLYVLGSGMHPL
jgi:hypothetical protein